MADRQIVRFDKGMIQDVTPYELPDGYAQNICGAICSDIGLRSVALSALQSFPTLTTEIIRGIISVRSAESTYSDMYWIFATSSGKLYRTPAVIGALSLTDVSKAGTTYADAEWSFAQYGDWVIGTNGVDAPQVLKGIATATAFADLGGSPPIAKYVFLDNGHLVFV